MAVIHHHPHFITRDLEQQPRFRRADCVIPSVAANSETLAYAYFAVAYLNKDSDKAKAKEYVAKALSLKPDYKDAAALSSQLNK